MMQTQTRAEPRLELLGRVGAEKVVEVGEVRLLEKEDLAELAAEGRQRRPEKKVGTPLLRNIRDTHHRIAQLLVSGMKAVEVSAATGFSQSKISSLKGDPAFQELLEHYRELRETAFVSAQERLAGVALDATAELHERLLEQPDRFSVEQLLNIVTATMDRTGNGPTTKVETRSLTLSASDLLEMKAEVEQVGTIKTVSQDRGSGVGPARADAREDRADAKEAERLPRKRADL